MITKMYEIVCDGDCGDCLTGDLNASLASLRLTAKDNGWQTIAEKDYCPDCAEKVRGKKVNGGGQTQCSSVRDALNESLLNIEMVLNGEWDCNPDLDEAREGWELWRKNVKKALTVMDGK